MKLILHLDDLPPVVVDKLVEGLSKILLDEAREIDRDIAEIGEAPIAPDMSRWSQGLRDANHLLRLQKRAGFV